MLKKIRYKCEYCGRELANRLAMEKHELECKTTTATINQITGRFRALWEYYNNLGYYIDIRCNGYEFYINVRKHKK